MRRILVAVVALSVVSAVVAGAAKAGTAEVEFSGGAGGFSPCNGEFVSGSGPGFAVVSEREGGGLVLIYLSMHLDMTGSFGNAYSDYDVARAPGCGVDHGAELHEQLLRSHPRAQRPAGRRGLHGARNGALRVDS
jgi:hypothetical protein